MRPNIAFYSDALTTGRRFGLGRYAWGLFNALHKLPQSCNIRPVSAHCTMSRSERAALESHYSYMRLPGGRRLISGLWTTLATPPLEAWVHGVDVVHSVELDYRVVTRKPWVVTIHDIGPLTHPQFFRQSHPWLLKAALKSAINRAAVIICVSHATADAVESYTKSRLGERLVVIPEGVAEEFFASPPLHHPLPPSTPYFLWAGSVNPRKNLPRLLDAFEKIALDVPHHLVLTGGVGWDSSETMRRIKTCSFHDRIHLLGHVSDDDLRGLYSGASAFVYVSLMEGFGLPILEAMASGCPVITSNVSSMPEVAGGAALLVNPLDVQEIATSIRQLAFDRQLAKKLSSLGRCRAEQFRWEDCATSTAAIYRKVGQDARAKAIVSPKLQPLAMKTGLKESS